MKLTWPIFMPGYSVIGKVAMLVELEGDVPVESGVDEPRRGVDDQPQPAERTLAFDAAYEIVGDTDALQRAAQHEFAGMQHEHAVFGDLDLLGEGSHVVLHVDDLRRVVAEHPEVLADANIDRRWLHEVVVERFDDDAAGGDLLAKGSVGEDHGRTLANARGPCGGDPIRSAHVHAKAFTTKTPSRWRPWCARSGSVIWSPPYPSCGRPRCRTWSIATRNRIVIRGHLGRGNDVHRAAPCEAMLIVAGADAYVSPAWYPSKQIDGKVVPTWNYEVVHLHGRLAVHDDPEWLLSLVGELTNHHEGERARPWSIDDAPTEYIDEMLRAIVGIELAVTRWACKRKLSQNRPTDDSAGVAAALGASTRNRTKRLPRR